MPVVKKPNIDAGRFIAGASENKNNPQNSTAVSAVKRNNGSAAKRIKMTYYMEQAQYLRWKAYELRCLQNGEKISFQGIVGQCLEHLLIN
jgi:hypothetical protein